MSSESCALLPAVSCFFFCAMLQGHFWTPVDDCSPMIRSKIPWDISFELLLNNFEKNFVLQLIVPAVNIPVYLRSFAFSIL